VSVAPLRRDDGAIDANGRDLAVAALALARRFSAGGRMWCCAPTLPAHAHHVAVEFVHPVIMGKRALPAIAVTEPRLADSLRPRVRSGDVLLAVAPGDDAMVVDVMRRAEAWGVETMWLGSGARPVAGAAGHVLWIDDGDPLVMFSGRLVLLYHLLWELTHVCFEHPGLLTVADPACTDDLCITCSDEGVVAEVVTLDGMRAEVRTADGAASVDVTLVGEVAPGDLVLVHAGTALTRVGGKP
jgi:hydrogenase maturation factor